LKKLKLNELTREPLDLLSRQSRALGDDVDHGEMLEGFDRLLELAPDEGHIVPGHDPVVMKLYPAPSPELEGITVRLDVPPSGVAPCRADYFQH